MKSKQAATAKPKPKPMPKPKAKPTKEKEGTAFARFELVDLGYEVASGQLERTCSVRERPF